MLLRRTPIHENGHGRGWRIFRASVMQPWLHPEIIKWGRTILRRGFGATRLRTQVGLVWCGEPAEQVDPDIATNPRLSPPHVGEHAEQTVVLFDVLRIRVAPGDSAMETIVPCRAGLDVHKTSVVACVRRIDPAGCVHEAIQTFGTITAELLALSDWLAEQGVTHVAIESTGVSWKPIFNLFGGPLRGPAGQPRAHEECAGALDRRQGLPVDRAVAPAWPAARLLHAAEADP